ncbi:hypothetical protein CROQUDRAFT_669767 [Cronartium quercuum f. sp. fusiforme G11]|uniref:RING-type E3 ubiquitin transferase n=1 Tax=Cronartium quercuum f. sp. fusiforme G11 TaxID=708437 RepID=A0A9P6NMG7_9BASI|nr:hypothetical protein CROQUDRAFT_669767 [Cronartium quercuum f. sp. fusiforme G11]
MTTSNIFVSGKPCRYYQAGYCWRGSSCAFAHCEPRPPQLNYHELPSKPTHCPTLLDDQPSLLLESSPVPSSSAQSAPEPPAEETCGICLELPTTYYGLLSACSHIFCMPCIRNWRTTKGKSSDQIALGMLRRCPLCRVESAYLVPSRTFHPEGPEKDEIVKQARSKWAERPCKNFTRYGDCSFGVECFYKHVNAAGEVVRLGHTHEEWLHDREEPEFPGTSLATRASRNGLDTLHMLARLLLHQPAVRDYLMRVTGAPAEDADGLLQRFASGEQLDRPLSLGRPLAERLAQAVEVNGNPAPVTLVDEEIDNLSGRDEEGVPEVVQTVNNAQNEPSMPGNVHVTAGPSNENYRVTHDTVDQFEARMSEDDKEAEAMRSDDVDGRDGQHSGEVPSTLLGATTTSVEQDQSSAESGLVNITQNIIAGTNLTNVQNETPIQSVSSTSSGFPPAQFTNGAPELSISTLPQQATPETPEQPPSQALQAFAPSVPEQAVAQPDLANAPLAQQPAVGAPSAPESNDGPVTLSQNVAPLARAILGPNLNRVADEAEHQMMSLLTDFLTATEAEEVAQLATRWLRGIIATT